MQFLTIEQVAERLQVCARTVDRLVRDGAIRVVKIRRVRRILDEELERWARGETTGARAGTAAAMLPPHRVDLETIARRATGTRGRPPGSNSKRPGPPKST